MLTLISSGWIKFFGKCVVEVSGLSHIYSKINFHKNQNAKMIAYYVRKQTQNLHWNSFHDIFSLRLLAIIYLLVRWEPVEHGKFSRHRQAHKHGLSSTNEGEIEYNQRHSRRANATSSFHWTVIWGELWTVCARNYPSSTTMSPYI